jgi:hypothetical protein
LRAVAVPHLNLAIYQFIERAAPFIALWLSVFTLVTVWRAAQRIRRGVERVPDSVLFTELPGLPIAALQSLCFVWALFSLDWLSALFFLWWGPGFVAVAAIYVRAKRRGTQIDWHRYRYVISWLCKGTYLLYAAVFAWLGMWGTLFVFGAWIINDQIEKAFLSLDADRLRRTFDDAWLFRILYPAGLLVPWFASSMPYRGLLAAYGAMLLVAWLCGIFYVKRKGLLRVRPQDPSLLRNMIYFSKLRQ